MCVCSGHYWAYVRKSHTCPLPTPSSLTTPTSSEATPTSQDKERLLATTGQYRNTNLEENSADNLLKQSNEVVESQQQFVTEGMETEGAVEIVQSDKSTPTAVQSNESAQTDKDAWLKFNDVSVTEVSWSDVQKESYGGGGSHNTSAYCLIYVHQDLHQQFTSKSEYTHTHNVITTSNTWETLSPNCYNNLYYARIIIVSVPRVLIKRAFVGLASQKIMLFYA